MAKKKKSEFWEWAKAIAIALILAGVVRYFLFTPIVVDGESMMPTLHNNDRMIVNKFSYDVGKPHRSDIVVFHATKKKDFIKRVIGLPGDHIEYHHDTLYVNGKKVKEPYLKQRKKHTNGNLTYDFKLQDVIGQKTVPKGEIFVMGDNRRNSKDSRIIGTIPIKKILGKASVLFWPVSDFKYVG